MAIQEEYCSLCGEDVAVMDGMCKQCLDIDNIEWLEETGGFFDEVVVNCGHEDAPCCGCGC